MKGHGDESRYTAGCRCDPCRAGHAEGARRRRRMRAYGRHVPKSVPNIGARRRVEALACLGWSMRSLSTQLGWHPDRLSCMFAGYNGISPRNHARIAALYDQLWDKTPPTRTRGERVAYGRTIAHAVRNGYLPPLAWDDDYIDNPPSEDTADKTQIFSYNSSTDEPDRLIDEVAVAEAVAGVHRLQRVVLTKPELSIAVGRLTDMGYSQRETAERLRIDMRQVQRLRARNRKDAA